MGAFDHVADQIRRPTPGSVASVGSVVEDLVRGVRQVQRQIGNGRRLVESRTGELYTAYDSHGPGGDTSHTFSFSVGSGGAWVAQIYASADTDATSGLFGVSVDGAAGSGTQVLPLSSSGSGSQIVTCIVLAVTDLLVTCAVDPGITTTEFTVDVTAYRIS